MTWIVPFDGCLFCAGPGAYFRSPQRSETNGSDWELTCELREGEDILIQRGSKTLCHAALNEIINAINLGDPIVDVREVTKRSKEKV